MREGWWSREATARPAPAQQPAKRELPREFSWRPRILGALALRVAKEFSEDKAPRLAAALAYYSLFSIGPLLVLVVALAGFVFGAEAVRSSIVDAFGKLAGEQGASGAETLLAAGAASGGGAFGAAVGVLLLVVGATGVFRQLKDALDTIWEVVPAKPSGVKGFAKRYGFPVLMVLGTGFLLLVSLVLSAALAALGSVIAPLLPGGAILALAVNLVVSLAVITVLFALLFRFVPSADVAWGDVFIGAFGTAILFVVGEAALGLYLGRGTLGSAYGAAGSVVVLLVWSYYSSMILLLGAEFTQVWANAYGSRVRPADGAKPLTEDAREQQGIPHG